jgi:lipopolysaccharide transport system ATP-binding protein
VTGIGPIIVKPRADGKLTHHGLANLPGEGELLEVIDEVAASTDTRLPREHASTSPASTQPTIVHVTHWKAGSQWVLKILTQAAPDRIVPPTLDGGQFLLWPIKAGSVYPTVYVTRQAYESVRLPGNTRRFIVIRDLRDTLVSAYFSFKVSHPILDPGLASLRRILTEKPAEEGFLYLLDNWLGVCASVQLSWLESGEELIRYEDMLNDDVRIFQRVLIEQCGLDIAPQRLKEIVAANRFSALTKGRARGQEDLSAHERKGVAGDWRNHFSPRIKSAFKARFGGLLVATGYETDLQW